MRRFKGEQGASAVEFALILSLLFIVLFGIIQFGITYNRYQGLNAAAREGARLASTENTTVNQVQDRVFQSLSIVNACNFYSTKGDCNSARQYSCPSLGVEQGCVEITQQSAPNTPLTTGAAQTCPQSNVGQTITVTVKYKMRITIPLWASPTITVTGSGVFRCE